MSLRKIILNETNQDLHRCQNCANCSNLVDHELLDISFEALIQLILLSDEEALTSKTVWSDAVLQAASHACQHGLDLPRILLTLRAEAIRRGLPHPGL